MKRKPKTEGCNYNSRADYFHKSCHEIVWKLTFLEPNEDALKKNPSMSTLLNVLTAAVVPF